MSRMSRLKREKRKNMIKTTSCGLALVLAIGSAQGLGTYALFTDTENVPSDIALSTGDVDVEVGKGMDFTEVNPKDTKTIPVTITNHGTLNQNISLSLDISEGIKQYLDTKFVFKSITVDKSGVMHNQNGIFVLAPGESITGYIEIAVKDMTKEQQNTLAKKKQNINLKVKSTQINQNNTLVDNGFYDIAIQENSITIAQREVITIATGEKAYFVGGNGNKFTKLYIPVNVKGTNNTIELSATVNSQSGTVTYNATQYDYNGKNYILIQPSSNNGLMEFKGTLNITITVTVKNGESIIETYELKCNTTLKNAGNDCADPNHPDHAVDGKCHDEIVENGHKTVLNIYEEGEVVEQPNKESEMVDPLKEDVEAPSEPELVEPPKEEVEVLSEVEVVEPQKEETIEVPKQTEVIDQLNENESIQE